MGGRQVKYIATSVRVLGHRWEVRFCTKKYFKKHRTCPFDAAVADADSRRIYVLQGHGRRDVIIHELVHAYFHEMGANSAELTCEQLEEVFCEMAARHGEKISKQSRVIHIAYRTLVKGSKA